MTKVIFITFEVGTECFWQEDKFQAGRKKFFEVLEGRFNLANIKENFEPVFAVNQLGLPKLKSGETIPPEMAEKILSEYEKNEIVVVDKCGEKEFDAKIKDFISKHKNFYALEEVIEHHHN